MASLFELDVVTESLQTFYREFGEDLQRLVDTHNPEVKSKVIKKIQDKMFHTALKIPFESHHKN